MERSQTMRVAPWKTRPGETDRSLDAGSEPYLGKGVMGASPILLTKPSSAGAAVANLPRSSNA
jgi:hypothetical protein